MDKVEGSTFTVRRVIDCLNCMLPRIEGQLRTAGAAGVGQGAFRGAVWPSLIPVGMFAVGVLLFTVPFWLEVRQSRPRLVALLQLELVAPTQ